jgi:hypothetical protein
MNLLLTIRRKSVLWLFVFLVYGPLSLFAQTAPAQYNFTKANGKFYLVTKENPQGVQVSVHILDFDGVSPTKPVDPVLLNDRAKLFQKVADGIGDQETGKKLTALFLGLSEQIKSGAIKDRARLEQVMTTALDLFLREEVTKAKWAPLRKLLNEQWVKATQEGATIAQYDLLLIDVAAGLDASAGGYGAISITTILKILTLIVSKETLDLKTILEILRLIGEDL